jgi:hypothetical protein
MGLELAWTPRLVMVNGPGFSAGSGGAEFGSAASSEKIEIGCGSL